ncbi:MAG: CvpA family protein [Treponema sp.]|jgi:membrane protein required for colicin V production|nr:CvpA family protein [Treponema sp.]
MQLLGIDIIFSALILIFVIRCALRGFLEEALSMAALVFGAAFAFFFHKAGADFIRERFIGGRILPELLAFTGLFLILFLAVKVLEYILRDILNRIDLGGVNRFLGIFFGLLEGLCLVSFILFILSVQPLFDAEHLLSNSLFARLLFPVIDEARRSIIRSGG